MCVFNEEGKRLGGGGDGELNCGSFLVRPGRACPRLYAALSVLGPLSGRMEGIPG